MIPSEQQTWGGAHSLRYPLSGRSELLFHPDCQRSGYGRGTPKVARNPRADAVSSPCGKS